MNDIDMTAEMFASLVVEGTSCAFTDAQLHDLWQDGYSVEDAIEYGDWILERDLFQGGEDSFLDSLYEEA